MFSSGWVGRSGYTIWRRHPNRQHAQRHAAEWAAVKNGECQYKTNDVCVTNCSILAHLCIWFSDESNRDYQFPLTIFSNVGLTLPRTRTRHISRRGLLPKNLNLYSNSPGSVELNGKQMSSGKRLETANFTNRWHG